MSTTHTPWERACFGVLIADHEYTATRRFVSFSSPLADSREFERWLQPVGTVMSTKNHILALLTPRLATWPCLVSARDARSKQLCLCSRSLDAGDGKGSERTRWCLIVCYYMAPAVWQVWLCFSHPHAGKAKDKTWQAIVGFSHSSSSVTIQNCAYGPPCSVLVKNAMARGG